MPDSSSFQSPAAPSTPVDASGSLPADAGQESLSLKWGTLKAWDLKSDASIAAFNRYCDAGAVAMGAMQQRDTPDQKQAICDLIDAIDGPIDNDWSGESMTKDEAKRYVMEYGQ